MSNRYDHIVRKDCPLPPGSTVDAYLRDSGHADQERSVAQQREAVIDYCKEHQLVLRHIYMDVRQGSDAERRDELNRMLEALYEEFAPVHNLRKRKEKAERKPFGLLMWKSSRIARDATQAALIKADLRIRGITIVSLTAGAETGDAALDMVIESVQQLQDQRYIDQLSEDSRRGLAQLVGLRDTDHQFRNHNPNWPTKDGRYLGIMPGVAPTGFTKETITVGMNRRGELRTAQRLVPDPVKGPLVRLAWEMRRNGLSISEIHDKTRLYNNVAGYSRMFQNRIYAGDLDYGGQRYEGFVEPIIPAEWFDEEQARRQQRALMRDGQSAHAEYHPRRVASRHLLSGVIRCGTIDGVEHPMHGHIIPASKGKNRRGEWPHYVCSVRDNSGGVRCRMPAVSARAIDKAVLDCLKEKVLTVEKYKPLAVDLAKELVSHADGAKVRLTDVEERIKQTERAIEHLNNALEDGGSVSSVLKRIRKREAELTELQAEAVALRLEVAQLSVVHLPTDAQIGDWLASIRAALDSDDIALVRQAVKMLAPKVVVQGKGRAVIHVAPPIFESATTANGVTHTRRLSSVSRILTIPITYGRIYSAYKPSPELIEARREAKRMYAAGMSYSAIARAIGVSWQTAYARVNHEDERNEKIG